MILRSALLGLVLLTVGCRGGAATKSADKDETCKVVARDFRTCGGLGPTTGDRPHIDRRDEDGWREIAGPAEGKAVNGVWSGHWRSIHVSPDRRTLLLNWSAECEVPTAFFLPAEGGELRPVAGKVESVGLGGMCGHRATKPGIYLVDPNTGKRKFVEGPLKGPMPLTSS